MAVAKTHGACINIGQETRDMRRGQGAKKGTVAKATVPFCQEKIG